MPDLLNGISNTHFVPCFTKAFWVHGTRDNAFLTTGRKEVFWQQAWTCLSFIPDSMWEGGGERERERRETLSSLSMILKMTIFQILFHYSEVLTDVRLLGSNPYSVITSVFISSFSPTYHTHSHKLKQRGIQQASVCLRSENGIPGDSFPSTHESKT